MTDKERNALIPLPSGGLENIASGPKSILSGMVSDALALARERGASLAAARFRIRNYEFCDPDYRQILIWAKEMKMAPEEIIGILERCISKIHVENVVFEVEEGSIVSLVWDFNLLPISIFEWVDGLRINTLAFMGVTTANLALHLPMLDRLYCSQIGLTEINLLKVSGLTKLWCSDNQITKLDLSNVPNLIALWCDNNQLAQLDISVIPKITALLCHNNQLAKIDLSNVPDLFALFCHENFLVELDLSSIPKLLLFSCADNQITNIDLSNVSRLTDCWCHDNQLSELDLSNIPELKYLSCFNNQFTEIDIRNLEKLTDFVCDSSVTLKKLPTQNF